jgi:hypothetical protein
MLGFFSLLGPRQQQQQQPSIKLGQLNDSTASLSLFFRFSYLLYNIWFLRPSSFVAVCVVGPMLSLPLLKEEKKRFHT